MNTAEASSTSPLILPLWPDGVPNSLVSENMEQANLLDDGDVHFSQVTIPEIWIYPAKTAKPAPAVVICPGGGYGILSYHKEGTDVAKFLVKEGITGIVLKYRLPNEDYQEDQSIAPLQDAQRALQLARQNANVWNLDPQKLGIMGFSAGGHLASSVAHQWKEPVIEETTPVQVRPDFSILLYPVITFSKEYNAHQRTKLNLLGEDASADLGLKFSAEEHVDEQTPPSFIVHSFDDPTVPIENSIDYARSLRQSNIPCEVHLYQVGGHGYGMRKGHADSWPRKMINWIRLNFSD